MSLAQAKGSLNMLIRGLTFHAVIGFDPFLYIRYFVHYPARVVFGEHGVPASNDCFLEIVHTDITDIHTAPLLVKFSDHYGKKPLTIYNFALQIDTYTVLCKKRIRLLLRFRIVSLNIIRSHLGILSVAVCTISA